MVSDGRGDARYADVQFLAIDRIPLFANPSQAT
jgi:hypothetical protein